MNTEKINEYKVRLQIWWSQLAEREQRALLVCSVFVSIFIFYAGIWSPWLAHLDTMRKQIQSQQKTLAWMQNADKEIQKFAGQEPNKVKALTPLALLSVLQKQVKQSGLESALSSLKQANNDSVEMHFQKVSFDKLIAMLTHVVKEHHVTITQLSATADATLGIVNADVVLK